MHITLQWTIKRAHGVRTVLILSPILAPAQDEKRHKRTKKHVTSQIVELFRRSSANANSMDDRGYSQDALTAIWEKITSESRLKREKADNVLHSKGE